MGDVMISRTSMICLRIGQTAGSVPGSLAGPWRRNRARFAPRRATGASRARNRPAPAGLSVARGLLWRRSMLPVEAPSFDPPIEVLMTRRPITIAPAASIESAAIRMKDCRIRHLPVVEGRPGDEGTLVGVLSSRDVLGASDNATVAEVMTRSPVTVRPEHPLASACERMLSGRFSCLPVLNDQRLIGVFTG